MKRNRLASQILPITEAVTLLALGEGLDWRGLAMRHATGSPSELAAPDAKRAEEITKIERILEQIVQGARAGEIQIYARRGSGEHGAGEYRTPGTRALVPPEVFYGKAEFYIGGPPFTIIEKGDNIFDAEWFDPVVDVEAVRAFLRKSRPAAKVSDETAAIDLLAKVLRENPDLTKRDAIALCNKAKLELSQRGFQSRVWPRARERAGLAPLAPRGAKRKSSR